MPNMAESADWVAEEAQRRAMLVDDAVRLYGFSHQLPVCNLLSAELPVIADPVRRRLTSGSKKSAAAHLCSAAPPANSKLSLE
jgi:hypothetical protein